MQKDFKRPSVSDKLFNCKGWEVESTLTEIDTYFYSLETNYKELQNFIISNQSSESYENIELDKEFFRLLSNFCGSIISYHNQTHHWYVKNKPRINGLKEFNFIKALRDTIVHNMEPPTKTTCRVTTKGVFVIRTINKDAYLNYLENHLNNMNDKQWYIKKSFDKAINTLKKYNENEIDIAIECEKCYNKLKNFNDKLKNRYKNENAKALEELDYMWNNLSEVAQER